RALEAFGELPHAFWILRRTVKLLLHPGERLMGRRARALGAFSTTRARAFDLVADRTERTRLVALLGVERTRRFAHVFERILSGASITALGRLRSSSRRVDDVVARRLCRIILSRSIGCDIGGALELGRGSELARRHRVNDPLDQQAIDRSEGE